MREELKRELGRLVLSRSNHQRQGQLIRQLGIKDLVTHQMACPDCSGEAIWEHTQTLCPSCQGSGGSVGVFVTYYDHGGGEEEMIFSK